jgi:Cu2+-exporting ATPase
MQNSQKQNYICPMHPEVTSDKPGNCPKCGMNLVPTEKKGSKARDFSAYMNHEMKPVIEMSFWERLKMSMTMSMGMEHTGLAGREMAKLMEEDIRNKFFFSLILTIPIIAYSPVGEKLFGLQLPTPITAPWMLLILTTPVFFYGGWIFLYSSYKAIQKRTLNMAVLIAVGITAAYGFSIFLTLTGSADSFYEAAAMLITFVLFGHWLEMKARRGTTDSLQALFALVPPQARILRNGKEELIPTQQVKLGDILILKPGDKVPVDGEITEGQTAIDESLVTGESLPVTKSKGDLVIGGSINQTGFVKFKATRIGSETSLAQIVKMVETAQNSKAPGQRLADNFAKYLVILAVGGGLFTFGIWFLLLGKPLLFTLTLAISTVVIACPDALGLATPTAVAVGIGLGAKHNILIKDAATIEQVSKVQAVVFDKTGTLTEGKPKITDVVSFDNYSENEVLNYIGVVEEKSGHPLSKAVLDEIGKRKLTLRSKVKSFENLSGLGVKAEVDGKEVLIGTVKLMKENNVDLTKAESTITKFLDQGKTIMILAVGNKVAGVVGAEDPIKTTAKKTIEKLNALGIEVAMITGDNQRTAETVAKKIAIKRVFAEVLPDQKAKFVKKLQDEGKFVAMVGDGVNDAPALAQADIGIAIGAGTDVAIQTAKVVLMKSDPADVLRAIRLSKATVTKMKQNLLWASIYNIIAIPVAGGLLYPNFGILLRPEIAALLMSISSIIVATNATILNRSEKEILRI